MLLLQARHRRGRGFVVAGLAVVLLLLAGCSDFVDQDQRRVEPGAAVTLASGHPVGQTFVARHGGLDGIEVWLEPGQGSPGEIRLHLRSDPQTEDDLVTSTLSLAQVTAPGFYRLSFPSRLNSHGQYFYAFLETGVDGQLAVGAGPGDAYLDGALYRDHEPLDAQMAFRLTYDPGLIALALVEAAVRGVGLLGVAALLYVVPGWALLAWLWPERLSWAERLSIAAGLSLAIYPLLLLWTDLVGLHLGALYAWGPALGGLGALAWRYRKWRPHKGWEALRRWTRSEALWSDVTLLAVTGLVFAVRLLVVRTLDAPMWGDSYQHTMMAQLLVDRGGLFDSWEPYAPYRSLTVHFGFPSTTALLSWATKLDSARATLLVGQLINGLAALTLYPLAVCLAGGNRWAGVGAVLTAGLLSPMPAYYVNWGRYAQLAGQAILPVALWLLWEAVQEKDAPWKATLLAGLVLAGMTLTYYRMPFYYATFVVSWLIGWGLPRWKGGVHRWLGGFGRLAPIAGIALLFFLPWGLHIAGGRLATTVGAGLTQTPAVKHVLADYRAWRNVDRYVPYPLLIAGLVALGWSLAQRRWVVASLGLWVLGLSSLVAGTLIRLPGANMMQNFAILIALYIPVGLLVGWLLGQIATLAIRRMRSGRWIADNGTSPNGGGSQAARSDRNAGVANVFRPARLQGLMGMAIVAAAVWAAVGQIGIIDPSYVMVTRPDARAMAWVEEHTPPEALFLVESFRIYNGRSAVGADAGWWLPLLADRGNTMPPQYALLNEVPADPDYDRRVVELVAQLETAPPTTQESVQLLCDWSVTHVYVGQGQGKVGAGAVQLFSPDILKASPAYREVYHRDRARVFALDSEACGAVVK